MTTETKTNLQRHVDDIARAITDGEPYECCPECGGEISASFPGAECLECSWSGEEAMSGFDYLTDALDIQYIVTGDKQYRAARILVAFGGPNIWINTQTKTVEGYWWGDSAFASYYDDPMGINDACEELWNCK